MIFLVRYSVLLALHKCQQPSAPPRAVGICDEQIKKPIATKNHVIVIIISHNVEYLYIIANIYLSRQYCI